VKLEEEVEMRVLLLKRRMLEKRVLVMRQPMEEGIMRANRRILKQVKEKTPEEKIPEEKIPEERAKVLLWERHRARTRRSNRQL